MAELSLRTWHETALERLRQAIPGGPEGWMPERLVFRDWWLWRDHELGFAHGRLALTGQNSGGKSTLMALCVPVLLDGETAGARLDPALSRDRYLHWYLLGEDDADPERPDAFAYAARTGYVALEFRHGGSGRYLTVGMGVSAARHHPRRVREWWGIVVPDRRLGRDWDVRGPDGNCLGPRDLARALPPDAFLTAEKSEYRRQVNARLFGMDDDDYQALIAMLLQARRPKLGEQAGPEQVCRLLRDALPGVSSERLERVAEVVENIERYQRNLAGVSRCAEVVAEADARLGSLAEALVQEAMRAYQETAGRLGNVAGRLQQARGALAEAEEDLRRLTSAAEGRSVRLREIAARLAVFRERPEADLPGQMADLQRRIAAEEERRQHLRSDAEQARGDIAAHEGALRRLAERFRERCAELERQWRDLERRAEQAGWAEGGRALARALAALQGLAVTQGPEAAAAAWPPAALAEQSRALSRGYRDLAQRRQALDAAQGEVRVQQAQVERLRGEQAEAADREAQAERELDAGREAVLGALADWRARSAALDPSDAALASVTLAVQSLEAVPPSGAGELLAPLRQAADVRRRELGAERRSALEDAGRAAVSVEALEADIEALRSQGPLPDRSALRRAARARAGRDGGWSPLFHWVRFREGVDEQVAARVEAAGLEAGLLDLLVGEGGGGPEEADAWLALADAPAGAAGAGGRTGAAPEGAAAPTGSDPPPVPAVPVERGATLLDVLEPEPGAPPAVGALLASVAWGEGPAERWIDADGRWRNGAAAGQVAPWLGAGAGGLVGRERRAAAGRMRLQALERARQAALERRAEAGRRAADAERAAAQVERDLRAAADDVPWQALFSAIAARDAARRAVEAATSRVEEARPAYEEAVRRYQAEQAEYERALALLPQARGLDRDGLRDRSAELEQVARRLGELRPDDLTGWMADHRERSERRARDAGRLEDLLKRLAAADAGLAELRAAEEALQRRLRDPEVAALGAEIERLERERRRLEEEAEVEAPRQAALAQRCAEQRALIAEREPEEAQLREGAAQRLERLKERLLLHERFAELARALEREGPVAVLPRLPRPVEPGDPQALEKEVNDRRVAVQQWVVLHQDVLGDYRPAPVGPWDGVAFHVERETLSAAELGRRLAGEAERGRTLIAEEERTLYERIIYQGILDELRRLIRQARAFTARTNEKLRALRLSGGEQLSLRLSACDPDQVPGAAVGAALEEMDQGTAWLSEERRELLLRQIQAEVERVRADARAEGGQVGYYEAIRQALDYRRWYEYHLLGQPPGASQAAPIRSRGFGRRSTSAKAWALAVPVLAGVAARYDAASLPDAPRLVALDEAFAGFDANNQANYLRFLGELGLCWIITCPEELPYSAALSAAMAYRLTLDGGLHTAEPVLWDGSRVSEPFTAMWEQVASGAEDGPARG